MAVNVETLEKLERKITLELPIETIQQEVQKRLQRMQRQVKMDGFRPGKVPMNVVAQRYGYSVHYEVMNDKVGEAFNAAAVEAQLRIAGAPRISEKEGAPEGKALFEAVFEVYPQVKIADLSTAEVEKVTADVNDAARPASSPRAASVIVPRRASTISQPGGAAAGWAAAAGPPSSKPGLSSTSSGTGCSSASRRRARSATRAATSAASAGS